MDDRDVGRAAFVEERRQAGRESYGAVFASADDLEWDVIAPTHGRYLAQLLGLARSGGTILDTACGAGKYWADIVASGRTVIGTDQLEGVLRVAGAAHPDVPTARVALQNLAFDATFDAVLCIDALEDLVPDDWPLVITALATAARPGAPLYVTVELSDPVKLEQVYEQARAAGHPVIRGERFDGSGYHYYPTRSTVRDWLAVAALEVHAEADGDGYWHLLLRRTPVSD